MKKLTRKALITIITIAVVFVVLGTATFAWITINNLASVRGMRMEVDTTNALQIEEETEIVEANFTNTVVNPGRNQIKYLQPVSSVDGKSFFYTQYLLTGVDGNGQLNDEAKLEEYDEDDFAMLYENVYPDVYAQGRKVQGYAEYTFILKAYASTDDIDVYLNEISFIKNDSGEENKTFRMAVLTKNLPGYASGQFADVEYNSLGIIASKEGSAARSIKNNQEYLAFGKTTAGDITVNSTDTIKMYTTNYGNVLFSDDATNFFTDAKKSNPYDLVLATDADARIELGDTTKLKGEEKVVGISKTLVDGKYEFKTNLGTTVYGNNAESARNDVYYIKNAGNNFEAYTMLKEHEVIDDQVAIEEVTLLNGLTFYKLTTKFLDENDDPTATPARTLYCASQNPDNATLFLGDAVDEEETAKDSYYEFVKEFDPTQPLMSLAQGKTGYVLVTLRIWVEGEDQDCTNTAYTTLGKDYQMNVKFGTEAPANGLYLN